MFSERSTATSSRSVGEVFVGDDGAVHREDERLLAELRNVLQDAPQVVALVHVDVVDAVAGCELEVLVFLLLRSPPRPERVNERTGLPNGRKDGVFHRVLEVVGGPEYCPARP